MDRWNVHELIHAAMILVNYHGLCGLIFGQGLKEEVKFILVNSLIRLIFLCVSIFKAELGTLVAVH